MKRRPAGPIDRADARDCRRPLVAYDGSAGAERALAAAIELASSNHGRLTILTAMAHIPYLAYTGAGPEAVDELRRVLISDAEKTLCEAVDRVPYGTPVTKILSAKPIEDALLQQAKAGDHDLLILGSRERGPIRSALFGSVGREMLRLSPLPVLIIRSLATADEYKAPAAGAQVVPMTPRRV
jgi:nucleotide-binding universal stress UspA family protein